MSDESRPARRVRPAVRADGPVICRLIRELAAYENALDEVEITEAGLDAALFGPDPAVFAHVGEYRGVVAGVALWFVNFSTWTGRHGIHLEDLFVSPAVRGPASAARCWPSWRASAWTAATAGWSGPCWTGTPRPWASTPPSARRT